MGNKNIYSKIEALLNQHNISAYRLSKDTGISTASLTDWKKGRSNPKADKIQIIADYFNVPISYFLDSTEQTKEVPPIKSDTFNVDFKNVKVMFYGDYELTKQEKKMVENVIKGVISSRKDERNKK